MRVQAFHSVVAGMCCMARPSVKAQADVDAALAMRQEGERDDLRVMRELLREGLQNFCFGRDF